MVGGHVVLPDVCSAWGAPVVANSLLPVLPHVLPGAVLLHVYSDHHNTASALEGLPVSFNLLARVVLGLN